MVPAVLNLDVGRPLWREYYWKHCHSTKQRKMGIYPVQAGAKYDIFLFVYDAVSIGART